MEKEDDSSDDDIESSLPQDPETCLQMNHVYQEVIQEKIEEVELLIAQNKEQQVRETGVKCSFLCFFGLPFAIFPCPSSPAKLSRTSQVPVESAAAVIVPCSYAGVVLSSLGQEPGSFSSWRFKAMSLDWPFEWVI